MKSILILIFLISNISYASLMKDSLNFLASDELKGRRAGTPSNITAANYIESILKNHKLTSINDKYKHEFTIFTKMTKDGENNLKQVGYNFAPFEPIAFSSSGQLTSTDIVFAGFGITIPLSDNKVKYDDYKNIDVKDKIVIILTGDPAIGNPSSPFRDPDYINYRTLFYKLKNAERHRAKGVIFLHDPLSFQGNEPALHFNSTDGGGSRFGVITGFTTNSWFDNISQKNILKLQNEISQTQTPKSFEMHAQVDLKVHLKRNTGRVSNILGLVPGTDPSLKREIIVLGAHFDHLGMGGQSSMDPSNTPKIHNGADDNASGAALIISLINEVKKAKLKKSILFVFFNAEELGLLGSKNLVSNWPRAEANYGTLQGMINFDMVGRFDTELSLMGTGTAYEWKDILSEVDSNIIPVKKKKRAIGSSDHASFISNNIPALFYTTGAHSDYHRSTDDSEKIKFNYMVKIKKHALQVITKIAQSNQSLTFDPSSRDGEDDGSRRGYGAHLGCVPEFGQSDEIVGVMCIKTTPNSPAELAGVTDGDILIQIGDIEIKNIYDLAFSLKFYRAGDKVVLVWKRGESVIRKEITLAKSRRDGEKETHKCHHVPIY